jgi:ribonuclease T1
MSNTPTRTARGFALALLALFVVFASVAACVAAPGGNSSPAQQGSGAAVATRKPAATKVRATATRTPGKMATATPTRKVSAKPTRTPDDGLSTIAFDRLPKEARETIRLIRRGGPFPFEKDGSTFGNREGLLPKRPNGYYKEYTVITPGSRDRGARRIVGGREGELYYTDDHYDSFRRVVE